MTKKTRKTAAVRRAEADALHAHLIDQVEKLTSDSEWMKFLEAARTFHNYSLNNLLLILAQRPDATQVAGFRQWQTRGRQVRKGEKGIKIRGYTTKRITIDNEDSDGEEERHVPRFPILTVFDISQTDPVEGAEEIRPPVQLLIGDDKADIVPAVERWLASKGWTFERAPLPNGTNGYTTADGSRRVVVAADLEPAAAAKTALHEAAHVLLHADAPHEDYIAHRGRAETEAESVAFVVAGMLGLDSSRYSVGYIAGWSSGDLEMIRNTAQNVLSAVASLTEAFAADPHTLAA